MRNSIHSPVLPMDRPIHVGPAKNAACTRLMRRDVKGSPWGCLHKTLTDANRHTYPLHMPCLHKPIQGHRTRVYMPAQGHLRGLTRALKTRARQYLDSVTFNSRDHGPLQTSQCGTNGPGLSYTMTVYAALRDHRTGCTRAGVGPWVHAYASLYRAYTVSLC